MLTKVRLLETQNIVTVINSSQVPTKVRLLETQNITTVINSSQVPTIVKGQESLSIVMTIKASQVPTIVKGQEALITTVSSGIIGPRGPSGISEEDMVYAKRVDFITDDLLYRGEASVGTLDGQSLWRIRRITISLDGDVSEEWADGSSDFTKTWNSRLEYSYI